MSERKRQHRAALAALRMGLAAFPGQRVCQLIDNAVASYSFKTAAMGSDLFYVTDAQLTDAISFYIREHAK